MNDNRIKFVTEVAVYLEGNKVGAIKEIRHVRDNDVVFSTKYRYFPKNDSIGGEDFDTLAECKASLL